MSIRKNHKNDNLPTDFLTDYSNDEKDQKWDFHKSASEKISFFYHNSQNFQKYGQRVSDCAEILKFQFLDDVNTGETRLKLKNTNFCRVRLCPVCQWRRSMLWRAKLFQNLPILLEQNKNLNFIFLTLTVKNCQIDELGETLKMMNSAFSRLRKLKKFTSVIHGYIKAIEVTKSKDETAHPHFHIILSVNKSYFKGKTYISSSKWAEMWKKCLRVDYVPVVDVRKIKQDKNGNLESKAIVETLKYTTKVESLISDQNWFLELTRQLFKKRFIDTGGIFKDVLKEDVTNEDLLLKDGSDENDEEKNIYFGFNRNYQKYKKINI